MLMRGKKKSLGGAEFTLHFFSVDFENLRKANTEAPLQEDYFSVSFHFSPICVSERGEGGCKKKGKHKKTKGDTHRL